MIANSGSLIYSGKANRWEYTFSSLYLYSWKKDGWNAETGCRYGSQAAGNFVLDRYKLSKKVIEKSSPLSVGAKINALVTAMETSQ